MADAPTRRPGPDVLHDLPDPGVGLQPDEAARRLAQYGPNVLGVHRAASPWRILLRQFLSPLIFLLLVSATVTALLQRWIDTVSILLVLIGNAAIGYWQESKAEREVAALQSLTAPRARVVRAGVTSMVDASALVPGDVVLLESGDKVPADLRLVQSTGLRVDESMLTGESVAVSKAAGAEAGDRELAFGGTLVATGRARGFVIATGAATQLGEIDRLVRSVRTQTPLQLIIDRLEKRIGWVVGFVGLFVLVAGLVVGLTPGDALLTSIALAVATIPEGLPVALTVAMSIGVTRMARKHAVVRSLPAVETLGSTTVIASDKTGTITENRLTVERVWTPGGIRSVGADAPDLPSDARHVLRAGALTNEAHLDPSDGTLTGDAVDVAIARAAIDAGAVTAAEFAAPPAAHLPYEPELRSSQSVRVRPDGTRMLYVKGAPRTILDWSTAMAAADGGGAASVDPRAVEAAEHALAEAGLRVIACAARELARDEPLPAELGVPGGLTFLGLVGMVDPPRPGVADAIRRCRSAGIAVKMLTGDHPKTAASIGERVGIESSGPPITGAEMAEISDHELVARLQETSIVARVTPQDKLRIVSALQQHGEIVAVTGDGVNDAPALRLASLGVAMGRSGTDVARESADMVLTDDDFVTIVDAVEQGRVTFGAIRKVAFFLLANAVAAPLAVALNLFTDTPLLFLPVQVLWFNLVLNGLQDVAIAFEPGEGGELEAAPRRRDAGLLSRDVWTRIVVTGVWMGMCVLVTFHVALDAGYEIEHARTLAMTVFAFLNFFQAGTARSERRSVFALRPWANPLLLGAAVLAVVLQALAVWTVPGQQILGFVPLSLRDWLTAFLVGATVLVVAEVDKWIRRRRAA
ncbi:putative cation-transporting ATPase F [Agromyces sp. NDB4Y10]|uniref:cation-translocating P-type ATPase n=1 Tax=Agromyces sp. NDB4Y10 TaxID=1775951 RepID=UPI0007B2BDFD|nr:HAD-IC family P-type ATPase [Agromyces sp. NDB4Y10]KZE94612.1 putative cation-transporting ATPase F [Agromyces sp. NDB4Y10]